MNNIADATHDIIMCGHLLSKMPVESRRQAVKEMYRVVNAGGIVTVGDVNSTS